MSTAVLQLILNAIGFAGAIYVFQKQGGNTATQQVVQMQKEQLSLQTAEIQSLRDENKQLHHDLTVMQTNLAQAQEKIKELEARVEGRDPDTINKLSAIFQVSQAAVNSFKQIDEIHKTLVK